MIDQVFAGRLLPWANRAFFGFLALAIVGVILAYGLGAHTTMTTEILGHWFIALGAFGIKASYVARLAALDVLKPHPDGWLREVRPPNALSLVRLDSVESIETRDQRKSA
jgi:pheromone shutdown protein TraB